MASVEETREPLVVKVHAKEPVNKIKIVVIPVKSKESMEFDERFGLADEEHFICEENITPWNLLKFGLMEALKRNISETEGDDDLEEFIKEVKQSAYKAALERKSLWFGDEKVSLEYFSADSKFEIKEHAKIEKNECRLLFFTTNESNSDQCNEMDNKVQHLGGLRKKFHARIKQVNRRRGKRRVNSGLNLKVQKGGVKRTIHENRSRTKYTNEERKEY